MGVVHTLQFLLLELGSMVALVEGLSQGQSTSPLHETPVPSMITLHTAHTGAFFRKTFSRKLCGSALLGCRWRDRQTEE